MPQIIVIVALVVPLGFVAFNRLRSDLAALIIVILLALAQWAGWAVLGRANTPADAAKAIAGFGQPVVLTLISLFIILRALDKTGVTRWLAQHLLSLGGNSEARLVFIFTTATALLSLFMNNLAAGAMLLPSAMTVSRRSHIRASQLLMPVAFGSLLGGVATYFTTANIIISDLLTQAQPPQPPLNIFDFTPTGGLVAVVGILFISLFGRWLLPNRDPHPSQTAGNQHTGSELEAAYQLSERLWMARVLTTSPMKGKTLAESHIGRRLGLSVVAIMRDHDDTPRLPVAAELLREGDVILVVGNQARAQQLAHPDFGLQVQPAAQKLSPKGITFVEAILAPRSQALGQTLKDIGLRERSGFTAVALWRGDTRYRTDVADIKLQFGDSLLLAGPAQRIKAMQCNPDFITFESDLSDQPMLRRSALWASGLIVCAIVASVMGLPTYLAMLIAAALVVLMGLVPLQEAYREMEWSAIFVVGGMYAASVGMLNTGLADVLGRWMLGLVEPLGALGLAAGGFLFSAALTQVMGGQVSVLVTGPIAISAAIHLNTDPHAIAVATAIGCSAAFLTPVAHPVNALVVVPGNYRFGDFARLGWALMFVSFAMVLLGMKLFWGL